jgi:hypothetical protein
MKRLVELIAAAAVFLLASCQHVEHEEIYLDEEDAGPVEPIECVDHDAYPDPAGTMVGSFSRELGGGCYPWNEPWIIPITGYGSEHPINDGCELQYINEGGEQLMDGDSAVYHFTEVNEPNFGAYTECLTNGVDQHLEALLIEGDCGGGGIGEFESSLDLGSPDLQGEEVDLIRLEVCSVSITPNTKDNLDGYEHEVVTVWEFWDL